MRFEDLPYCSYADRPMLIRCLLSPDHEGPHALVTEQMWNRMINPDA